MRGGVCAKEDPVLKPIEEGPRSAWLTPQFVDARSNIDRHVRKSIQIFGDVTQIFGEVADM
jgi:hypothetical protein